MLFCIVRYESFSRIERETSDAIEDEFEEFSSDFPPWHIDLCLLYGKGVCIKVREGEEGTIEKIEKSSCQISRAAYNNIAYIYY